MQQTGDALLKWLFVFIWVITLLHFTAEQQYWYWTYRWVDIPMHFLGGVWVGLVALWLWYYSGLMRKREGAPTHPLAIALVGGMAFGVVWEAYELLLTFVGGITLPSNYVPDSLLDLVMDACGAVTAYGLWRHGVSKNEEVDKGVGNIVAE